jgi:hypothetical protein
MDLDVHVKLVDAVDSLKMVKTAVTRIGREEP